MGTFKLWAGGDAHVGTDLASANRSSLADAILQAEQGGADGGPPFEWDIMLDIGDLSGSQAPPDDEEGQEVVRQYSASTKHPREDFYNIVGNHDASGPDEPCQWWFQEVGGSHWGAFRVFRRSRRPAALSDRGDLGAVFVSGGECPVSGDG